MRQKTDPRSGYLVSLFGLTAGMGLLEVLLTEAGEPGDDGDRGG